MLDTFISKTFAVQGMTCGGCRAKIIATLESMAEVDEVQIDLDASMAEILMNPQASLDALNAKLSLAGQYSLTSLPRIQKSRAKAPQALTKNEGGRSRWLKLYPLFLILIFLAGAVVLYALVHDQVEPMPMMLNFMGVFFVVFSFFKLLDLSGFAQSFQMYDPLAKTFPVWGKIYPFLELGLGLAFLLRWQLQISAAAVVILLSITLYGVFRSIRSKTEIECACLGSVFKLPMTQVTLFENLLMIAMGLYIIYIV